MFSIQCLNIIGIQTGDETAFLAQKQFSPQAQRQPSFAVHSVSHNSVQNPVQSTVHGPVHSPVQSPGFTNTKPFHGLRLVV